MPLNKELFSQIIASFHLRPLRISQIVVDETPCCAAKFATVSVDARIARAADIVSLAYELILACSA
jgi:hypothetical protein